MDRVKEVGKGVPPGLSVHLLLHAGTYCVHFHCSRIVASLLEVF